MTVQAACVDSGTSTVCTCSGSGDPWPSTYWTRYGNNIVLMNGSQLVVPNDAESDGSYACHLNNTVGKVSSLLALTDFGKIFMRKLKRDCSGSIKFRNKHSQHSMLSFFFAESVLLSFRPSYYRLEFMERMQYNLWHRPMVSHTSVFQTTVSAVSYFK